MKFIDIYDCEYEFKNGHFTITFDKKDIGDRTYLYIFTLNVIKERDGSCQEYDIEKLSWGPHTILPIELEILKRKYRFEMDDMMGYYRYFLIRFFDSNRYSDKEYNSKRKKIIDGDQEESIGTYFEKFLKRKCKDDFNFKELIEIEKLIKKEEEDLK